MSKFFSLYSKFLLAHLLPQYDAEGKVPVYTEDQEDKIVESSNNETVFNLATIVGALVIFLILWMFSSFTFALILMAVALLGLVGYNFYRYRKVYTGVETPPESAYPPEIIPDPRYAPVQTADTQSEATAQANNASEHHAKTEDSAQPNQNVDEET